MSSLNWELQDPLVLKGVPSCFLNSGHIKPDQFPQEHQQHQYKYHTVT